MREEDLVEWFPKLWHMAEDGSWPSIRANGLLSTSALLDRYGVEGSRREAIEAGRRAKSVTVSRPGLPDAVIRDQKPMSDRALRKCLDPGLETTDWYRILNGRTFFWLSQDRLRGLLAARAYRKQAQTVLTLDTKSLVAAHRDRVRLSPINSGSTLYVPRPRGTGTFLPIADYPFEHWRARRTAQNAVVELVVLGAVLDAAEHVTAVHCVVEQVATELWRRPGSDPDDGP